MGRFSNGRVVAQGTAASGQRVRVAYGLLANGPGLDVTVTVHTRDSRGRTGMPRAIRQPIPF